MSRLIKITFGTTAVIWAVFVFLASTGPEDAMANYLGWWRSIGGTPSALVDFASSSAVIAITSLVVGLILGWKLSAIAKRKSPRLSHDQKVRSLGYAMMNLATFIENFRPLTGSLNAMRAEIQSVSLRAHRLAIRFPTFDEGFKNIDDYATYLHMVGRHLADGELATAMQAASQLSSSPPQREQSTSYL